MGIQVQARTSSELQTQKPNLSHTHAHPLIHHQVDATPPSASGTITPAASAAAVPGYEDTPPDRIRRALNGEGNGPSRLGPDDHVRRMFACRDALVAAAEHGDTDALTLLVRHTVFRWAVRGVIHSRTREEAKSQGI